LKPLAYSTRWSTDTRCRTVEIAGRDDNFAETNPMTDEDICGAETSDGGVCQAQPMDNGRCYHHGGATEDAGAPEDNDNAWKHGAYSEVLTEDFSELEQLAYDRVIERLAEHAPHSPLVEIIAPTAGETLIAYKRSGDERKLSEFRHLVEMIEEEGEGDVDLNVTHEGEVSFSDLIEE